MTLRRDLSISRESPINAFDLAAQVGADVRFLDAPSLEGMFVRDPGLRVLLPSTRHRPKSRILFSCAHEVGHYQFGHGTKADQYIEDGANQPGFADEEFLADSFAAQILLPRAAVLNAFGRRDIQLETLTPAQVFLVAGELGVGYSTLLHHLDKSLDVLLSGQVQRLLKTAPKSIKASLTGEDAQEACVADEHWGSVPLDIEQGTLLVLPEGRGDNCTLLVPHRLHEGNSVYVAKTPGFSELSLGRDARVNLRVARRHYIGPLTNRYLIDPDEH